MSTRHEAAITAVQSIIEDVLDSKGMLDADEIAERIVGKLPLAALGGEGEPRCPFSICDGSGVIRDPVPGTDVPLESTCECQITRAERESKGYRIAGVEYEGDGREWWLYRMEDGRIVASLTGDLASTGLRLGEKLMVVPKAALAGQPEVEERETASRPDGMAALAKWQNAPSPTESGPERPQETERWRDDRAWTLTCENYVWHASPHASVRAHRSAGPIVVVPAVPDEGAQFGSLSELREAFTAEREMRESAERQREDIKRMLRAERERREEDVAEARREGFDAAASLIDFAAAQVRRTTQGRILAGLSSVVAHARDETLGALAPLPDRGEGGA